MISNKLTAENGFSLIELVMIIVILGILSTAVAVKWPSNMQEDAAVRDFIRAVRYSQHLALTRDYDPTTPGAAWGILVAGNQYDVKRADDSELGDPDYQNHPLPGNTGISAGSVWFNGLGEPVDLAGSPVAFNTTFTIGSQSVTVYQETGYVE